MSSWPELPPTPQLLFFSEDYFSLAPKAQKLAQWMWQSALTKYPTSSISISPIKKHDLESLQLATKNEIYDIFLGERKYFFTLSVDQKGEHTRILLCFDIEHNDQESRELNPERLEHALVIGMASYRALKILEIAPQSFFLSSVRSIGLQLERVRDYMERYNLDFYRAMSLCSHDTAMIFDAQKKSGDELDFLTLSYLLKNYASGYGVNWARFLALGATGESLEDKKFSLRKLATHLVTLWPTLSKFHENHSKNILARLYQTLGPLDIPLEYLGAAFDIDSSFRAQKEVCVVFDMRGRNFELLKPIFENPEWALRFSHRILPFKSVFIKDASMSDELFQTSEARPFCPDQILLNFEEIGDIEELAKKTSLYVRGEAFSNLNDDLLSLYLITHGCFLFMDQQGWWQKGFRFEFGRRWEPGHERSDYFITQFFDVLIQLFDNEENYRLRLNELRAYLTENYSSEVLALRLKESYIDKLASFHEHLHCFELSNFHKLDDQCAKLSRYWDAMSAIHLDIEGDYLMLESHELPEAFYGQSGNFIEALELSINLTLYAPKINSDWLSCELIVFDEQACIKNKYPLGLTTILGRGTSQHLSFELPMTRFNEREKMAIRLTPKLSHFEFPFELKLSAWV